MSATTIRCHGCGEKVWTDGEYSTVTCRFSYDVEGVELPQLNHESEMDFCSHRCIVEWAIDVRVSLVEAGEGQ
jgi:hypothetical protein